MSNPELDRVADQYLKTVIESATTVDPVDDKGNLVDQNASPTPRNKNIIMALDAQDAQNLRMANLAERPQSLFALETRYRAYVDRDQFKNPRSVFAGPLHPWHYYWAEDFERGRDGVFPLSEASRSQLELIMFKGYQPADLRKLEPLFVTGEDAALLAINRRPNVIQALAAKKPPVPPPPILPRHLWDKFGMLMPPTVDSRNGSLWIGRFRLYMIDRRVIEAGKIENRKLANGDLHQQGNGITREQGSLQGRYEIDLDQMLGSGGR